MESCPSQKRSQSSQENDGEFLDTAHCNANLWACQHTLLNGSHHPSPLLPKITNTEKSINPVTCSACFSFCRQSSALEAHASTHQHRTQLRTSALSSGKGKSCILQNTPLVRAGSVRPSGKAGFASKCLYLKTQGRTGHLKFRCVG